VMEPVAAGGDAGEAGGQLRGAARVGAGGRVALRISVRGAARGPVAVAVGGGAGQPVTPAGAPGKGGPGGGVGPARIVRALKRGRARRRNHPGGHEVLQAVEVSVAAAGGGGPA